MTDNSSHISVSWKPTGNLTFTDHSITGKDGSDISIITNGGSVIVPSLNLSSGGVTFPDGSVQTSAVTRSQVESGSQADWSQIDPASPNYIKNKPSVVLPNSENYASFYNTTAQSAASNTAAYQLTVASTRLTDGSIALDTNDIVFYETGTYFLQCSIHFSNTANIATDVTIWLRKNSTDVDYSGSAFTVPAKTNGNNPAVISAVISSILDITQNDRYQIMWQTDNSAVSVQSTAAQTAPVRPIIPGVKLQIQRIK
jgi:hypothetical protein